MGLITSNSIQTPLLCFVPSPAGYSRDAADKTGEEDEYAQCLGQGMRMREWGLGLSYAIVELVLRCSVFVPANEQGYLAGLRAGPGRHFSGWYVH